ncbi:MAG: cell division protein ZipA C-terminal FtsZ-binding domain-containing protein [Burkholderiales bacterium]|nr:cell division protein ZipA C-terminal FtsZ-binding domain-containing protein [Burkholderiales bacterium]
MSDLQIGLVLIGLLAVVAVYAFNRMQENKYRQRAERAFSQQHVDVLLEPQDRDPAGGDDSGYPAAFRADTEQRIEPQFKVARDIDAAPVENPPAPDSGSFREPEPDSTGADDDRAAQQAPAAPAASAHEASPPRASGGFSTAVPRAAEKPLSPESTIDYVADVEALEPIAAAKVAGFSRKLAEAGKPVRCSVFNPRSAVWENGPGETTDGGGLNSGERYTQIRCAIQLADRQGAISEAQLRKFRAAVTDFASQNRASFECPPVQPALSAARRLDQFCVEADIAIGINVLAEQKPFSGTKIRALAEAAGMKLEQDGAFHMQNEHGATLFTLANRDTAPFFPEQIKNMTTPGLTLLLDVPRVADGNRVFNQMIQLGRSLAATLGGKLVDDNRRALNDSEFEAIRHQMTVVRAAMDAQKISAGSPEALRLFS